jgi:hypothetical protein
LNWLNTIAQSAFAALSGAVRTTKHTAAVFNSVADNFAAAMITSRCHLLNCALEAVEDVRFVFESDLERLVVVISAVFTPGHKFSGSFLTFRFG